MDVLPGCVYIESFCSFVREKILCLFSPMLLSECCGPCFCSLSVHYTGSALIVHAEASECAVMIMVQGQECQQ